MYNSQQIQGPSRPQQLGMQSGAQTGPQTAAPNEIASKEKLAAYVYEYLVHSGATKTAETFKAEVLATTQNAKTPPVSETTPGFLQNWWLVFWDLYCAAPERRDENPHSQEAKYFYQMFVSENQFHGPPMMNGMGQFPTGPSPMGMAPGPDGMIPGAGFPGRFPPGRGPPGPPPGAPGMPPAGFPMFANDPRMVPAGQRMPPQAAMRMSAGFPGMRPGQPGMSGPYARPGYIDSPGTAFPQGMIPNGGVMCSQSAMSLSSPSAGPPISQANPQAPADPNNPEQRFMMMPTSSSALGFGMGDQMGGTPINSMAQSTSNGSAHENPPQIPMMNGEEIKQSPASTPRGANGTGTPGAGPGSQAPGSAQSGGAQSGGSAMNGPETNVEPTAPSNPPQSGGPHGGEDDEIKAIKQSIFEDAKQFDSKEEQMEFYQ
ncbi:unnamed protein product, partial [Mesorhabditis belari]|uniref:LisH domain-containing protein n=1 Tax=Mesorhabditis belari TaxID=2138241 RepID=A0AAF3ETV2_9BILA